MMLWLYEFASWLAYWSPSHFIYIYIFFFYYYDTPVISSYSFLFSKTLSYPFLLRNYKLYFKLFIIYLLIFDQLGLSLVAGSRGYSLHGLLIMVSSLVVGSTGSRHTGFVAARRLSSWGLVASWHVESFQTSDWTHVPLHLQADYYTPYHQASKFCLSFLIPLTCCPRSSFFFLLSIRLYVF